MDCCASVAWTTEKAIKTRKLMRSNLIEGTSIVR